MNIDSLFPGGNTQSSFTCAQRFLSKTWSELGGRAEVLGNVHFTGAGNLASVFSVSDFAAATLGAAGAAIAELIEWRFAQRPRVSVNRRLASLWYGWSIKPEGWSMPAAWDSIAGD